MARRAKSRKLLPGYSFDRNQEIPTLLGFVAGAVSGEDAEEIVAFWKASCIPHIGCTLAVADAVCYFVKKASRLDAIDCDPTVCKHRLVLLRRRVLIRLDYWPKAETIHETTLSDTKSLVLFV